MKNAGLSKRERGVTETVSKETLCDSLFDSVGRWSHFRWQMNRRIISQFVIAFLILSAGTQAFCRDDHPVEIVENSKSKWKIDTVVICPAEFQPEMTRWISFRENQGHGIVMIQPKPTAAGIQTQIRLLAKNYPVKNLLLVGDCYAKKRHQYHFPPIVARGTVRAKVNVKFRSEPIICTDNIYADLDDDRIPDLTIGRLSVDSPAELRVVVDKILAYENNPPPGPWRRKINLVAGVGGFGSITDRVIETAARQLILKGIPPAYETKMTYASWRSPYCPDPRNFHDVTLHSLNEGCLFWAYFGHGHIHQLDQVNTPISRFKILNIHDKHKLNAVNGSPIALFLACYTGAMDSIDDCLAEEMLESRGGPVAVFAGSRVTMPYAMAVLSHEMLRELFSGKSMTLGELILRSKQRLAIDKKEDRDPTRTAIEGLAGILSPTRELLDEERMEHVQLFNLFGDPLLRLPKSNSIPLTVPGSTDSGNPFVVKGKSPYAGTLLVELSYDRAKLPFKPKDRKEFKWSYQFLKQLQTDYVSANYKTISRKSFRVDKGDFEITLPVPETLRGKYQVRAFLENRTDFAMGCSDIRIR